VKTIRVLLADDHNVVRHSGANSAHVRAYQQNGDLCITIDDGCGFDPARSRGMGMLGVEEQVRRLGGRIEFRSAPGQGTTISADLPLGAKS
jgi:signal transduction histidine kinase